MDLKLAAIIAFGMLVRIVFAAVSWNPDWDTFVGMGHIAYDHSGFFGVYTAGAYFFAFFYALWLALPISHSSYLLFMKLPSLIFDLLTALLIYHVLSKLDVSKSRIYWALGVWLLSPLSMIADGFNGFEVVPAFFLLLSTILLAEKKRLLASTSLAIAGVMRFVPFIVLPFFLVSTIRGRDWKGAITILVPQAALVAGVLSWLAMNPGLFNVLSGDTGLGLLRPEVFDVLGVKLSSNVAIYPGSTIAMTAFSYLLLLGLVMMLARPSGSSPIATEVYLPIFAYVAFSFSAPTFLMYAIPFSLITMATLRGYQVQMILLSVTGCLWSIVRSPLYLVEANSSVFYIQVHSPFYPAGFLQDASVSLQGPLLWIQSYLQAQITAAFTAIIVFLIGMTILQSFRSPKRKDIRRRKFMIVDVWSRLLSDHESW
jgi:hypothetical protein